MSSDAPVTFLTQDAYDRLANELEYLSTTGREEIAKRIESAREEGDLKENGGYHAAKDEQGKQEARIRTLKALLKDATVGEAPQSHGVVESGTIVTAIVAGGEERFLLGNREIAVNGTHTEVIKKDTVMNVQEGSLTIQVDKQFVQISAQTHIILQVGSSSIKITDGRIEITSDSVDIFGKNDTFVHGKRVDINK